MSSNNSKSIFFNRCFSRDDDSVDFDLQEFEKRFIQDEDQPQIDSQDQHQNHYFEDYVPNEILFPHQSEEGKDFLNFFEIENKNYNFQRLIKKEKKKNENLKDHLEKFKKQKEIETLYQNQLILNLTNQMDEKDQKIKELELEIKNKQKNIEKKENIDKECKICFNYDLDTILLPCAHVGLCYSCSKNFINKNCPFCN